MKAIIISTFPGCGKTYLEHNPKTTQYTVLDIDSSHFKGCTCWEKFYIDYVESHLPNYDFILVSQQDSVLLELMKRKLPFVTVSPDNSNNISLKEKMLIKQQWFGRFILRDNSHIKDINSWLIKMEKNYDIWTSPEFLLQFEPLCHFVLKQNQYLSDILDDIKLLK